MVKKNGLSNRRGNQFTLTAARGRAATKRRRADLPDDVIDPAHLVALVNEAAERLDVEVQNKILGCGSNGCVVPLKKGHFVLKISSSGAERRVLEAVRDIDSFEGFALIVAGPLPLRSDPTFFAYVRESVTPYVSPGVNYELGGSFLAEASDSADNGDAEGYVAALDAFEPPYLEIAVTMRRLYEEACVPIFDANLQNMGWRSDGTLVLYDAEAADWFC